MPILPRYFLHLAYDGTDYCGWQIQPGVPTVQETLVHALQVLVPPAGGVVGCGRTDTGVHASDYYAQFDVPDAVRDDLVYRINKILPRDIAVYRCFEVPDSIHARYSATRRTYKYHLHVGKNPFLNHHSVYLPQTPDVDAMNRAASYLVGLHDFSSFSRSQTQTKTNLCEVFEAHWEPSPHGLVFTITANRFLRNMVRAIVGTLLTVGQGKLPPEAMAEVIAARDRAAAGKSAHPQGLFLHHIYYPQLHESGNR